MSSDVTIQGAPGIGKATSALTIMHTPDIIEQSGMERDHELRGIGEQLGDL
jgi:hypothetical protein